MIRRLQDRVALVTGASRGIGLGIAKKLAQEGAHLAFTYKSSAEAALNLQQELVALGVQAKAYASDASDYLQAEQLIESVLADFGHLDIVVNNAGITRDQLLLRMTEAQWDEVLDNNLKSVFNICKHAVKPMMKARSGSI
ncbi:MAG: SDR family NAD(P)-dependent oxidoreductase, partial [Bacteroidota bacterium]